MGGLLPTLLFAGTLFLLPGGAVAGLAVWARWLVRQTSAPRVVQYVGYGFVLLGALPLVFGVGSGLDVALRAMAESTVGASHKARALAEGISEAMNCGAVGFLMTAVGGIWLGGCTWRWRPTARGRLLVCAALVALVACAVAVGGYLQAVPSDRHLNGAVHNVNAIRVAQEAFHAETGGYANVSRALAANESTDHFALYPQAPRETGTYAVDWGGPCPPSACNEAWGWAVLPVHLDGRVRFAYTTIAGRAGERPNAIVRIAGTQIAWPTPKSDWYLVTAVGDLDGNGRFTTVLATSWDSDLQIDRPAE